LQFSLAARSQYFSLKRPEFYPASNLFQNLATQNPPRSLTGDATISYFLDRSNTKFRAHIGNGYRVPSLYERFSTFFFFSTFFQTGNPALKPEHSEAFDFGADQTLASGKVKLSGTYFYTRLRNLITFRPSDTLSAPAYFNFDGAISRGAEFSGRVTPHRTTDVTASFTFINSDQRVYNSASLPAAIASNDRRSFGIPNHQFSLVATQRIGVRLAFNFDFLATGNYLAPIFSTATFQSYTYQFRGARRGDFSATYEIPTFKDKVRFRLYGTVENLFGYEYFENGFRTIRRTARGGFGLNF
jgi:iron complex outermembrane receptor protein